MLTFHSTYHPWGLSTLGVLFYVKGSFEGTGRRDYKPCKDCRMFQIVSQRVETVAWWDGRDFDLNMIDI